MLLEQHLRRRTGETEEVRNWRKWNFSTFSPIFSQKYRPSKPLMKNLAKLGRRWNHLKSEFFVVLSIFKLIFFKFREMREYKARVESYSREMLRKESQIKELQGRIENGDGCKFKISIIFFYRDILAL